MLLCLSQAKPPVYVLFRAGQVSTTDQTTVYSFTQTVRQKGGRKPLNQDYPLTISLMHPKNVMAMKPVNIIKYDNKSRAITAAGVTLIELLVAISILAILLTIGVPSFRDFFVENRVKAVTTDFLSSLNLARSEAIKRGGRVVVCKSSNPTAANPTCSSGAWSQGWVVFVDVNNNAVRDAGETVLQAKSTVGQVTITDNFSTYISFTATGSTKTIAGAFQAGTVTVCSSPSQQQVIINNRGRIQVQKGTC